MPFALNKTRTKRPNIEQRVSNARVLAAGSATSSKKKHAVLKTLCTASCCGKAIYEVQIVEVIRRLVWSTQLLKKKIIGEIMF